MFAVLGSASTAWAAEGVIVQRDGDEVVVDLGRDDGLEDGARVAVYRRLEVVHPVTKKKIEDRFPIGSITLKEVGTALSIADNWSGLEREPQSGDYIVFSPKPKPPPPLPVEPEATTAPIDRAWRETLGKSLHDRVEVWERFLRKNPETKYSAQVQAELHWLRTTIEGERRAVSGEAVLAAAVVPPEPRADGIVTAPHAVEVGDPIRIDVAAQHPERVDKIRVNYRRPGDPTFEVIELEPSGDYNWSAEIPVAATQDVPQLEYFAETIRRDGQTERAASETTPIVDVREPAPDPLGPQNRSRATMVAEYVDFKAGAGDDEYSRFEAQYRYAVNASILSGFTVGVGIFRGLGATLADINAGEPSERSMLSYGFLELDLGLARYFGVNTRLLVGNNQQLGIADSVFEDAFGVRGEMRFGPQDGTQLLVGAAFTETIGSEAWVTLAIDAIERVPMSGEVIVTNLPIGGDLGVSLNYGAGYAFTDWFALMGRVGWNARTITHHGPTAGLSTVFSW